MRILFQLCFVGMLFLAACSQPLPQATFADENIAIFPDYREVTIPATIAPLNFKLKEPAQAILLLSGEGPQIRVDSERGAFRIPEKAWRSLLSLSCGKAIQAELYVCKETGWLRYPPFQLYVSEDAMDSYLAYRRIAPGYRMWNEMGIYQRNLENFEETAFLTNKQMNNNCMNCHAFCQQDPNRMLFHQRMTHAGTYILKEGAIEKLDTKIGEEISALVYPYWHPNGRYVAFSTNDTKQDFHLWDKNRIEVFDNASDVVIYDTETHEVLASPVTRSKENLETFPTFSPDGQWLYFVSAPAQPMPESYRDMKYNLLRISFDSATRSLGQAIDTLYNAGQEGRSAKFPRISPDGRFLMFTLSDYGNFSIWHRDADLQLLDLETGMINPLEGVNSEEVESYHSWSSNGRWFVFSSRRGDGLYTRPYICHITAEGEVGKPFLLPQQDPDSYDRSLFSFNIPEFLRGKIAVDTYRLIEISKFGQSTPIRLAK